jgi:hypothetical protein
MTAARIDACKEKDIALYFNWIKGHSDNVGNDFSDYLSVIGTSHGIDEKEILDIRYTPGKKFGISRWMITRYFPLTVVTSILSLGLT